MSTLYRVAPAILLFFLAPLVAEFVLGDLTFAQIGAFFALAPLYGGGAILIREIVRRSGRGWPTFLLLGLAYAFLEEALLTQSLFNPNYLHLRLIDYGFVPTLGTALPWAIFVLAIHVCWSLAVPIGLVESAFPDRRAEPWLKLPGLLVVSLFLAAGALLVSRFSFSQTPFRASSLQILLSSLLILISVAAAFFAFSRGEEPADTGRKPANPMIVGIGSFAAGSAFLLTNSLGHEHLIWQATASLEAIIIVGIIAFFAWTNRERTWTSVHSWAAATGGLLCYVWLGYTVDRSLHGPGHAFEHSIFVVAALLVAAWAGQRTFGRRPAASGGTVVAPA
jgi:hypothetical protein